MQMKPSTPIANSKLTVLERLIARLQAALEKEDEVKHPGILMSSDPARVDDGGGYSGQVDDRPDFVKADEIGWVRPR